MNTELVELRMEDGIATLALNRPEKRNALNDELRAQLVEALAAVQTNPNARALILTGNGKAFCAGGDIIGMQKRFEAPAGEIAFNGWSRQQQVHHAQMLLHTLPIPTIAAVNGSAAGLGADTALACDFILASRDATFAWSYVNRGLIPDGGALYFLPRRVGLARAKELIFTGRTLKADEALAIGVADRVSEPQSLLEDARAWGLELTKGSRTALALGKTILDRTFELTPEDIFARGSQAQAICYTSTEHRDSVHAFLEKASGRS